MLIIDKVETDWRLFLLSKHVRSFNLHPKRKIGGEGEGKRRSKELDDARDGVIGWAQSEAGEMWLLPRSSCGGRGLG